MNVLDYSSTTTPEGHTISSMSLADLNALRDRCALYRRRCVAQQREPDPAYLHIEEVCHWYLEKLTADLVHDAYQEFEQARKHALDAGYMVPNITAGLGRTAVLSAAQACREAVAATVPLPGEPTDVTARVFAEMQAALSRQIEGATL